MTITKNTIEAIKTAIGVDVSNVRTITDLRRELDFTSTDYTITEENDTTYIETTDGLIIGCDVVNDTITWLWIE